MPCILPDIKLADINVTRELGVFIDGKVQGYSFRPPNPQNKHFGVQETSTELCGTVDVWIIVSFPTFFLEE